MTLQALLETMEEEGRRELADVSRDYSTQVRLLQDVHRELRGDEDEATVDAARRVAKTSAYRSVFWSRKRGPRHALRK